MKKIFIFLIFLLNIFLISCNQQKSLQIDINNHVNTFKVGEKFILNSIIDNQKVEYIVLNKDIVSLDGYQGIAIKNGETVICAYHGKELIKKYLVKVVIDEVSFIDIIGLTTMSVGNELVLTINSDAENPTVVWESNNTNIATVDEGKVFALSEGIVTITCKSFNDNSIYDEHTILVKNANINDDYLNNQYQESVETVDLSSMKGILEPIIKKTKTSVIGINCYINKYGTARLSNSGTALIYKRLTVLDNGLEITNESDIGIYYRYYAIVSKGITNNSTEIKVFYNDNEIEAKLIAVDQKVDIGVITFISKDYFSIANIGNSDEVNTGEFVIAYGNSYGSDYVDSATFGVVSYNSRYVGTDTDNDEVNDWDALYIQHDAAIGNSSSGGPLVNMKGEVIGINSVMIADDLIDNMAFAIPINLVMELVSQLEKGIVPTRPLLLISVVSVKDILKNDYLLEYYPVPDGLTYGMFVAEVTEGGVGSAAGMLPGDIIVEFNGKKIAYSYELRMMLNEVIIGSNQENIIIVNRNGKLVTLKVVF